MTHAMGQLSRAHPEPVLLHKTDQDEQPERRPTHRNGEPAQPTTDLQRKRAPAGVTAAQLFQASRCTGPLCPHVPSLSRAQSL